VWAARPRRRTWPRPGLGGHPRGASSAWARVSTRTYPRSPSCRATLWQRHRKDWHVGMCAQGLGDLAGQEAPVAQCWWNGVWPHQMLVSSSGERGRGQIQLDEQPWTGHTGLKKHTRVHRIHRRAETHYVESLTLTHTHTHTHIFYIAQKYRFFVPTQHGGLRPRRRPINT